MTQGWNVCNWKGKRGEKINSELHMLYADIRKKNIYVYKDNCVSKYFQTLPLDWKKYKIPWQNFCNINIFSSRYTLIVDVSFPFYLISCEPVAPMFVAWVIASTAIPKHSFSISCCSASKLDFLSGTKPLWKLCWPCAMEDMQIFSN